MVKHVARAAFGLVALSVVVGLAGGCAGYKIEEGGTGCGYDVYAPEPYLQGTPKVVDTADGKKIPVYEFTLIWLPNYKKRYRVHSWAGLGKMEFTATFENGWKLTTYKETSDNTNIMTALTTLIAPLMPKSLWDESKDNVGVTTVPSVVKLEPLIYRIDFDEDGRPSCLTQLETRCLDCPPTAGAVKIYDRSGCR